MSIDYLPSRTRSSPVQITNHLPRRKPTSVRLDSWASGAIRLAGAQMHAMLGTRDQAPPSPLNL